MKLNVRVGDVCPSKARLHMLRISLREPFVLSLDTQYNYLGTIVELGSDEVAGLSEGSIIPQTTSETPRWRIRECQVHTRGACRALF